MNKKVLVIEDDQDTLNIIEYILHEDGFTVVPSLTSDILSNLSQIQPDLILFDCWLQGVFGDQLCRDLKSNPLYQHIPIIIISAINDLEIVAKACNADGFIEKPFDIHNVSAVVKQYCP